MAGTATPDLSAFSSSTTTTDGSVSLLGQLFGTDFHALITAVTGASTGAVGAAAPDSIFGQMFGLLNAFSLVATGLVVLYMWSVSVAQTAHEGEVGGKALNTLWAPIRTVAAVVFVTPFPGLGGFSLLQALIIGMVSVSINGGNLLYKAELTFFKNNGYSLAPINSGANPSTVLATQILQSEMCASYFNNVATGYNTTVAATPINKTGVYGYSWDGSTVDSGYVWDSVNTEKDMCGKVSVDCSDIPSDKAASMALCEAKGQAVMTLAQKLQPLATVMVTGQAGSANAGDFNAALDAYRTTWFNSVSGSGQFTVDRAKNTITLNPKYQSDALNSFVDDATNEGWISAGKWYWTISTQTLSQIAGGQVQPSYDGLLKEKIPDFNEKYLPAIQRASAFLKNIPGYSSDGAMTGDVSAASLSGNSKDESTSILNKVFGSSFGSGSNVMTGLLLDGNDPIRALAEYGQTMIGMSWVAIDTFTALRVSVAVLKGNLVGRFVNGASGAGDGASIGLSSIAPIVLFVVALLMTVGATYAYYIPIIPFIFWSLAVLGWLIMVVQSLIAAPLWAASHAVGDGEGFAGRYALQGWQLFVNVIFRPVLLTIGLLFSMFMMEAITHFTLAGYKVYNLSLVNSTSSTSVTGFVFTNIIMVSLVVILTHKAHEIIYETADDVMKWMGFGVSALGATRGAEETVHRSFDSATQGAGRAVDIALASGKTDRSNGIDDPAGGNDKTRSNTSANSVSGGSDVKEANHESRDLGQSESKNAF